MNTRSEFPTAENSSNMNGFGTTQIASTLDALKASIAGETGASAKYAGYAKAADEAGYPQVAKLFRAASAAEQVHIGMEAALVEAEEPDYVRPTAEAADPLPVDLMLIDAANGEIHETSDMYPEFIKKAQEEGNDKAVKVFTKAKLAESVHAEKYLEAYNNLDAADDDNYYLCPFCGYIHKGAEAPEVCPICGAKKAAFKEF